MEMSDLSRQQQQQMAGETMAADAERLKPLDPVEKHHAETLTRLLQGNEDPRAIAREHYVNHPSRMGQPGLPMAQNPGLSNAAPPPGVQNLGGGGAGLSAPAPDAEARTVQVGVPARAMAPPGQQVPQRGLSNPRMSMAGGNPGAQPIDPSMPQTQGDYASLLEAMQRAAPIMRAKETEGDTQAKLNQQMLIAKMLEGGRNDRASESNTGKNERQQVGVGAKKEIVGMQEEGKNERAGVHETNLIKMNRDRVNATYYGIDSRMKQTEMHIAHAKSAQDIAAAKAELDSLDKDLKSTADNESKMLAGIGNVLNSSEGAAAMKAHADELAKTHGDLSVRVAAARAKMQQLQASGGLSKESGSKETKTTPAAPEKIRVRLKDGRTGNVPASAFDPNTMTRL